MGKKVTKKSNTARARFHLWSFEGVKSFLEVSALVFMKGDGQGQLIFYLCITVVYTLLITCIRPYAKYSDNFLAGFGGILTLIIIILALAYNRDEMGEKTTAVIMLIDFFIYVVAAIISRCTRGWGMSNKVDPGLLKVYPG